MLIRLAAGHSRFELASICCQYCVSSCVCFLSFCARCVYRKIVQLTSLTILRIDLNVPSKRAETCTFLFLKAPQFSQQLYTKRCFFNNFYLKVQLYSLSVTILLSPQTSLHCDETKETRDRFQLVCA